MPDFCGQDLGPFVMMQTEANPIALQVNEYPGVGGLEILNLGSRGGTTHVQGACYASTVSGLGSVEQIFRGYQANATRGPLTDSTGTTWPNVILIRFLPFGPISWVTGYGWGREYIMEFLHAS